MLEVRGVTKVYETGGQKRTVLNKITVNFRASEFAAILGPSGSGKTTLLNIIGGLDQYTLGDLIINNKSTKKFRDKDWDSYRNHRVGFVFQSYNLIPHQTVLQNVRLALTLSGVSKRESIARAKKALRDVGLSDHIYKRPAQLSGGQMQRVAIARALVNDPDILLADEPTGALDSETSLQIMELLKEIAKQKLVVMVTHNPELAEKYATRTITLKDGKITSDSNPWSNESGVGEESSETLKKQKNTHMSFMTALSLSLKNLLTKKARTILVSIAGSIGIIGIALISAVSAGFQNYIDSIEHDTLTSYPLALRSESTNVTGTLLSLIGNTDKTNADGKIHEVQVLSSALGSVTKNDLPSFRSYLDNHYDELADDIRLIEYEYNVDPTIYTIDKTGELAKLNPSNLFSTLLGESSLMNAYSSLTSAFRQYDLENMKADTKLLAGRYPEKYNEMVVILSDQYNVSDFLTYSLGFHDTDKLSEIITKIMGGESVDIKEEPLILTYDDFLNVDLRLVYATDTYKYNEKYSVYEDMSENTDFMMDVYKNKSEELKIVGVITPNSDLLSTGSGVLYLPSLITHIIEESEKSEIVKQQLDNPTLDIFSNTKFGEKSNSFNFEFSDLVSVDNNALSQAFNMNIDENQIKTVTAEYMKKISESITTNTVPAKETITNEFNELATVMRDKVSGPIALNDADGFVEEFLLEQDLHGLLEQYVKLDENFAEPYGKLLTGLNSAYSGLLKGLLTAYIVTYSSMDPSLTEDPTNPVALMNPALYDGILESYTTNIAVQKVLETLGAALTETSMQQKVLTSVLELTNYLSQSFANAFNIDENKLLSAFKLNFTEDELSRVISAMFNKKESTLNTNLALLGYQDIKKPFEMSFYFNSFDGKTHFIEFLDRYNGLMKSYNSDDKIIEYTDTTGILMSSVKVIVDAVSYVLIAFVSISLVVSSIMIGVITYISVYERTKEIGILRAIGASKHNISSIFNAETFIIGFLSGLFGITVSYILIPIINLILHHFTGDIPLSAFLDPRTAVLLILLSIVLTLIGGLIPAKSASKKDPVEALRSE